MTDSLDERRQQFYNPSFNGGFFSLTWFESGKQTAYQNCLDIAWKTLLAEDDWYAWLKRHASAMNTMDNLVWFEDRDSLKLRKSPGPKAGVNIYVPAKAFGKETSAIELMRAVIVLVYVKAANLLEVDAPPDFGVSKDLFA